MTTSHLHDYFGGIFVFRSLNNLLPERFSNIFFRKIMSRLSFDLRPHYCTRKANGFSIKCNGPNFGIHYPIKLNCQKLSIPLNFKWRRNSSNDADTNQRIYSYVILHLCFFLTISLTISEWYFQICYMQLYFISSSISFIYVKSSCIHVLCLFCYIIFIVHTSL